MAMRVSQTFGSYNQRRYGRPWIGKITNWPVGKPPTIAWGCYLGDDEGGEAEIEANDGDIVRWGQKDHRGNDTSNKWGIVLKSGGVLPCDAATARDKYNKEGKIG